MSFPAASNAGSVGDLLFPGVSPRAAVTFPIIYARNDTDARNTTVNMFIDSLDEDYQWAASVIDACVETTVYALHCTAGSGPGSICGPNAAPATLTYAGTNYQFSSDFDISTMGYNIQVEAEETCRLQGTTAAICSATVEASASGTSTKSSSTTTLSGSDYYRFDVEITSGAEKIASPTACKSGAVSSLNSKTMSLWALVSVMGIASFLSM